MLPPNYCNTEMLNSQINQPKTIQAKMMVVAPQTGISKKINAWWYKAVHSLFSSVHLTN